MNTLTSILAFVQKERANGNLHRGLAAAEAVIAAFQASPHASDGDKAQKVADAIATALEPILPSLNPIVAGVVAAVEPYLGAVVDWTEFRFAPQVAAIDDQNGAPVDPPT